MEIFSLCAQNLADQTQQCQNMYGIVYTVIAYMYSTVMCNHFVSHLSSIHCRCKKLQVRLFTHTQIPAFLERVFLSMATQRAIKVEFLCNKE